MRIFRGGIGILTALALCLVVVTASAEEDDDKPKVTVDEWILLGPVSTPFPAFSDEDGEPKAGDLLEYGHVNRARLQPTGGARVAVVAHPSVQWKRVSSNDGRVSIKTSDSPHVAYLAAYVEVPRWMKWRTCRASTG